MTGRATELVLVRHGETAWNRELRIQGQLDTPLNDEGLRQARAAARALAKEAGRWRLAPEPGRAPPGLASSDLLRCRQTAEPIAASLGIGLTLDPRLRERAYGVFEGKTYPEVRRDMAERFERWLARDPDFDVDGGETLRGFAARVEAAVRELAEANAGRTLVLVTHGGVLDIVHRLARDLPLSVPRDWEIPNASLNRLRVCDGRFEIVAWGEVGHWRDALDEIGPAP